MKEIPLTKNKITIVDDDDYEWLKKWKWHVIKGGNSFYALRNEYLGVVNHKKILKTITMHREIINAPKGVMVDHINGDGLDNRKSNLRLCNKRQNGQNRINENKSSKFPGVTLHKKAKKWHAQIEINGKHKNLGYFINEKDAAIAYEKACRELGEELICKSGR